jgi:large repetitive protein
LSLIDVLPGTQAKLVLRLVNNDNDTETSVVIRSVRFESAQPSAPLGALVGPEPPLANAGTKYVPPFQDNSPSIATPPIPEPDVVPGRSTSAQTSPSSPTPPSLPLPSGTNSNVDSRGTEFWVGFPDNLYEGSNVPQKFLFLTGESATTGVVEIPGLVDPATSQPFRVEFAVNPGTVTTIELPSQDVGDNVDPQTDYDIEAEAISRIERKGVHVTSDLPITVYGLNRAISTSDAFLALPVTSLGNDYLNISYQNTNASISSTNGTQLLVVATEDDTNVSIVPGPYSPLLQDAQATLRRPSGSIPFGFQTGSGDDFGLFTTDQAGEYRWNVAPATDGYAGKYIGNVVDLESTAVPISIGERVDVNFLTGGEVHVFALDVQAGQDLYFDALDTLFQLLPTIRIVSPTGHVQYPSGDNDSFVNTFGAFQFNETGTYYVVLIGGQSASFQYAFRWLDFAQASDPGYGTTIDTNHTFGETKLYQFNGQAGQQWYYDAQESHRSIALNLYGPGGNRLVAASSADDQFLTLPVDGTYYVLQLGSVFDRPNRFRIDDLSTRPLLSNQQSFTSTFEESRATTYRFQAQAGDTLQLDAIRIEGRTAVEVYDPAGNRVTLSGSLIFPPRALTGNLSMTGTYTLVVLGNGYQDVGEAELRLSLTPATSVTPGGFNTIQTLFVPAAGSESYSFTGQAGTAVIIDSLDSNPENLFAELYAPDGTRLAAAQEGQDFLFGAPFFLPYSGTYTVTARGNNATAAGTYSFRVLDLVSFATPINLSEEVQASLSTGREIQVYSFQTQSGVAIGFDGRGEASIPVNVYDHQLRTIINTNTASDRNGTAITSGTHFVVVFGQSDTPTNYSFEIESLTAAPLIPLGTEISGSLSPGRSIITYQVNLSAGQPIRVDSLDNDGDQVQILIFSAGGRFLYNGVHNADSGPPSVPFLVVNEPGNYFIVVQSNQASNADYRFRIDDLSAAPILEFDKDQSISMEGQAAKVFRFEAQAGELIRIDRIDTSPQNAIWQVVSASNQFLGSDNNAGSFTARILRSGTHYFAISGYQSAGALNFNSRLAAMLQSKSRSPE